MHSAPAGRPAQLFALGVPHAVPAHLLPCCCLQNFVTQHGFDGLRLNGDAPKVILLDFGFAQRWSPALANYQLDFCGTPGKPLLRLGLQRLCHAPVHTSFMD
jgi:hypothetical protein